MTELMKRHIEEGGDCKIAVYVSCALPNVKRYIEWLEAKAATYDRLMSGGKKTLKEIANFLGNPVAVDREGRLLWFPKKPEIGLTTWIWYDKYLPKNIFDYTGDWKNSLTLPDGWEERL